MMLKLRIFYIVLTVLTISSDIVPVNSTNNFSQEDLRVRVRRQDGYVYDKPNVSFDLPSRSTPAPTQAPNVDRTLTQQMYYAYPVPAAGDTGKIGNAAGTTSTAAATATSGGYNYRSSSTGNGNAGYNYGTPSAGTQANTGSQVTNTGLQTTVTGSANTGTSQGSSGSGYGYNVPLSTPTPTLQGSTNGLTDVSTNAPRYLPPTSGSGNTGTGGSVNIGSVSVTSGSATGNSGTSTSVKAGPVGTPSDSYLPPKGTSNTVSSVQTVTSTDTGSQTNNYGSVSVPSTGYLPPVTSSLPSPVPAQGLPSSQPAQVPPATYIPPSKQNSGNVPTPATAYLPPSFF